MGKLIDGLPDARTFGVITLNDPALFECLPTVAVAWIERLDSGGVVVQNEAGQMLGSLSRHDALSLCTDMDARGITARKLGGSFMLAPIPQMTVDLVTYAARRGRVV